MRDARTDVRKEVKGTGLFAVFTLEMDYPFETGDLTDNPSYRRMIRLYSVKKNIISVKELLLNAGLSLLHSL